MIRKGLTYLFMALANLIMIGHGIFPHHHHENQVCFKAEHCRHDGLNHDDPAPLHEHDCDHNGHSCFFSEFIPNAANLTSAVIAAPVNSFGENACLQAAGEGDVLCPSHICMYRYAVFSPLLYLFDIQSNSGLRAPPVA